jgi:glycosyltransferase involved in cell wall biosynthesis
LFVGADVKYMAAFRGALIRATQAAGYDVLILATPVPGFQPEGELPQGARFLPWNLRKAGLNPLADVSALRTLWGLLRDRQCKLVFAHTIKPVIYAMVLAWFARVPRRAALIPGLGYAFTEGRSVKRRVTALLGRLAYTAAFRCAHVVLFQNPDDQAEMLSLGVLDCESRGAIVNGSGVDMEAFPLTDLPEGPPTFLMVARLIRDKGVYEFIEAARRVRQVVPAARFVLVGAPDENPAAILASEIQSWVSEGIVEAPGHLPDPRPAYAACHVFVLPSYYREGTPRTNLEAMATGRPIITTDSPGCRETVIDGHNGILIPPRDAGALADAMIALARSPELIRTMGQAGRRLCHERFELWSVTSSTLLHVTGAETRNCDLSIAYPLLTPAKPVPETANEVAGRGPHDA